MIVANGLTKSFGRFVAVDSARFEIPRGAVAGFLGPNGAGKTTTIRMLCGVIRPEAGGAAIDGMDVVRDRRRAQQRTGYLPEAVPLYTEMRVAEYLRYRARLYGVPRSRRAAAIDRALAQAGLADVRRRPIGQLSRGYRQRVGLAAALVHDPPVLILDEPTVGLDPTQVREVRRLIQALSGERTIMLSTHILAEVELICDRIVMIAGGTVRASGSIVELIAAAGTGCYVLETDSDTCAAALERLPAVDRVASEAVDGCWTRLTVTPRGGEGDLREVIARLVRERGAAARELRREAPTLEGLFVHLLGDGAALPNDRPPPRSKRAPKSKARSEASGAGAGR